MNCIRCGTKEVLTTKETAFYVQRACSACKLQWEIWKTFEVSELGGVWLIEPYQEDYLAQEWPWGTWPIFQDGEQKES